MKQFSTLQLHCNCTKNLPQLEHSEARLLEPGPALKCSYDCGGGDCFYIRYYCSLIAQNLLDVTVDNLRSSWKMLGKHFGLAQEGEKKELVLETAVDTGSNIFILSSVFIHL